MAYTFSYATLQSEHAELKLETDALRRAHERLLLTNVSRADRRAHRLRLRQRRLRLTAHFGHLRRHAQQRQIERQRALADQGRTASACTNRSQSAVFAVQ